MRRWDSFKIPIAWRAIVLFALVKSSPSGVVWVIGCILFSDDYLIIALLVAFDIKLVDNLYCCRVAKV